MVSEAVSPRPVSSKISNKKPEKPPGTPPMLDGGGLETDAAVNKIFAGENVDAHSAK